MSARRVGLMVLVAAAIAAAIHFRDWPAAAPDRTSASAFDAHGDSDRPDGDSLAAISEPANAPADIAARDPAAPPAAATAPTAPVVDARHPGTPTSAPILSASAARALMLERQRESDCQLARSEHANTEREQTDWPWMPPERVAAERQAIAAATARMTAGCAPPPADDAERERIRKRRLADLEAATRAGDLHARLEGLASERTPAVVAAWRATLYDAVLSGDPEALSRIWRLESRVNPMQTLNADSTINRADVWGLVACDLGLACGPGSRALDRACFHAFNGCGYDSLEAMIRDRSSDRQYQLINQRRTELVARIRSGQVAGMFDPPPPVPARPGGG